MMDGEKAAAAAAAHPDTSRDGTAAGERLVRK